MMLLLWNKASSTYLSATNLRERRGDHSKGARSKLQKIVEMQSAFQEGKKFFKEGKTRPKRAPLVNWLWWQVGWAEEGRACQLCGGTSTGIFGH